PHTYIYTLSLHDALPIYFFENQHGLGKLQLRPERRCLARGCETQATRRDQGGTRIRFRRFEANFDGGDAEVGEVRCSFHCLRQRRGPNVAEYSSTAEGSRSVYLAGFRRRGAILPNQKDQSR